jgi:hypothetical protein
LSVAGGRIHLDAVTPFSLSLFFPPFHWIDGRVTHSYLVTPSTSARSRQSTKWAFGIR